MYRYCWQYVFLVVRFDFLTLILKGIELGTLKYREVLQELQPWIVGDDNLPDISRGNLSPNTFAQVDSNSLALQLVVELLKTVQTPMNRNDGKYLYGM